MTFSGARSPKSQRKIRVIILDTSNGTSNHVKPMKQSLQCLTSLIQSAVFQKKIKSSGLRGSSHGRQKEISDLMLNVKSQVAKNLPNKRRLPFKAKQRAHSRSVSD